MQNCILPVKLVVINLVTLYHTTELRQNWPRWCLGAVRHQANTWANVDLSSVGFSDIHWSDIQLHRSILQLSITHISQRVCFSYLKFHLNTPGTNELCTQVIGRSQYRSAFLRQCHKKIITSTTKNENNVFGLQYQWRALIHQHCSCRKLKRGAHPISTGESLYNTIQYDTKLHKDEWWKYISWSEMSLYFMFEFLVPIYWEMRGIIIMT